MSHETKVHSGNRHQAKCSCGWYVVTTVSREHAELLARAHLARAGRPVASESRGQQRMFDEG